MQATLFFWEFHFVWRIHQSLRDVVQLFLEHIALQRMDAVCKQNAFNVIVFMLNDSRRHTIVGLCFLYEVFIQVLDGYFGVAFHIGSYKGNG